MGAGHISCTLGIATPPWMAYLLPFRSLPSIQSVCPNAYNYTPEIAVVVWKENVLPESIGARAIHRTTHAERYRCIYTPEFMQTVQEYNKRSHLISTEPLI